MKTILLVGDSSKLIRSYILNNGNEYVQLRDIRKCKNPEKRLKRRVVCDFSSDETMQFALDELTSRYKIDGVFCNYENYVLQSAKIAKKLGIPGMPVASAEACTDKYIMRQLFSKAVQKISPDFAEVSSLDEVLAFANSHEFPLILKPANLAKSLLVTKNTSIEELTSNFEKTKTTIGSIYNKYAPNRTPKLIIEEFMEGPIYSVDAFIDINGTPHVLNEVVDYKTGYEIGYDDNFHYSRRLPSALSEENIKKIREVAALGCVTLGMKSSPAHIEIILTKNGPMIVEIGARNGGYRDRMHYLANGIDILHNAFAVATNDSLRLTATKNNPCAVLELFPKRPGTFVSVKNEDTLKELSSLEYFAIKQRIGTFVGKSSDGYKMCVIIILHNTDVSVFNADLEYVNNNVYIETTE